MGLSERRLGKSNRSNYDYRFVSIEHVSGACQVFRRDCFVEYRRLCACQKRRHRSYCSHHRQDEGMEDTHFHRESMHASSQDGDSATKSIASTIQVRRQRLRNRQSPALGDVSSIYQMTKKPFVVGGPALSAGYLWACVSRAERPVSVELMRFLRREQMLRLKGFLHKRGTQSKPQELSATRQ